MHTLLMVSRTSPRVDPRARFLLTTLAARYKVHLVTSRAEGLRGEGALPAGATAREVRLALPGRGPWLLTGPLRLAQLNLIAVWVLLRVRPELVLFSDATYALAAFVARLQRGPPYLQPQEIVWAGMPGPIAWLFRLVDRWLLRHCDLWIVPSRERAEFVLQAHGLRRDYLVIENLPLEAPLKVAAPDRAISRAMLGIAPEARVIMFQGNLFPRRGLHALLEVAGVGSTHVVIQGAGPLRGELGRAARGMANVHLVDACPNEDTLRWLAMADLAWVYYGDDNPNSALACSGKFYNAVYAGVPVVCNPLPAFRSFNEHYGGLFFVDTLEVPLLRERLREILADAPAHTRAVHAMRQAAASLARTPRAERLLQAVAALMAQRASHP
jgi:glycosyltransferase involved in cell wall biosynthesis